MRPHMMYGWNRTVPEIPVSHCFFTSLKLTLVVSVGREKKKKYTLASPAWPLWWIHSRLFESQGKNRKKNIHRPLLRLWRKRSAVHLHLGHRFPHPGSAPAQSQATSSALNSKSFGMGDQKTKKKKKKKAQKGASEVSMRREIVHLYSLPITRWTEAAALHHV